MFFCFSVQKINSCQTEITNLAPCGHHFIDHSENAQQKNNKMQHVYLKTMAQVTAWRANKKTLPQPVCPEIGKLLTKVSPPELVKKHVRCHCLQLHTNWHTGDQCPNDCKGHKKRKCPVCWCTCSLYVTEDQHHKIFILATMSNDGAAEVDPGDNARKFIVDSLGVGAMQHQVLVEKHNKMMSDGNIQMRQGGVAFLSNVVNAGGLAQGLFIVGNLLSQLAASFLCEKVRGVAHRSGKTCINLCGETIDLCTYGKSATLNAAGKCNSNNCLDGNVEPFAVDVDDNSVDESPQLIGVKTLAAPTPRAVVDDVLAGKLD